ncbi:MAG: aminoacyl-tRNA hydrolase [bacterium]|nr:aminoacyl-tRNA hydrolase [bacterium]MDZ4285053.1 aminoacyl-tRNA hydrolase [Patescibacteria group bacterium]
MLTIKEEGKRKATYLVVGLGNPGVEYERTRHNAGRRALEALRERGEFEPWREDRGLKALKAGGAIDGARVTLLLPQQFMNRSGASVASLVKSPRAAERLIVAYDDLDLPLGVVKISFGRSSGGHKGLESVIRAIKTRDFTRVRIGIAPLGVRGKLAKPRGEQAVLDFLLGAFSKREEGVLTSSLARACDAIMTLITDGREKAMSAFNRVVGEQ